MLGMNTSERDFGVIGNLWHWIQNPFLSPYLSGTATLLAGMVAWFVYLNQKADKKRAAARLVYHEIVYADQIARNAGKIEGIKYHLRMLPSQNWLLNKHLFIGDFNREQLQLIDEFYARASDIDRLMDSISLQLNSFPAADIKSMNTRIVLGFANTDGTTVSTHQRIAWLKEEIVAHSLLGTTVLDTLEGLTFSRWKRFIRKLK